MSIELTPLAALAWLCGAYALGCGVGFLVAGKVQRSIDDFIHEE